ncbi:MAG: response regulator [Methylophaga sp.]|nr:response regulator [Methylophaga sp.]
MQRQALVVDDSRVARLTLSKLLAPYDLDIVQIASGEEALSYLNASNVNPDIIFMDVTMQGLDGLETTKKIKENESLSAIPVVMCTGHDTQGDQDNAIAVGAIAALTKPPQREILAEIMNQLERHVDVEDKPAEERVAQISSVMEPVLEPQPEIKTTPLIMDDVVIARLEQEWLPGIQKSIYEQVGDVTRRIVAETVKGIMANQVQNTVHEPRDDSQLEATISANIENNLLPKIQQIIQERVEDVSRQIVLDSMETSIASHLANLLPSFKEQLKEQTKQATVEVAQKTAQQMIDDTVESAVQFAIDDFDLPLKAMETLEQQGNVWIEGQEQRISLVASQQVEQNVSPLTAQYLDMNLAEKITSHLAELEAEKPEEKEDETNSLVMIQLDELTKKVSFLKEVVMVLSVVVVSIVAVALLLNAGIL